MKHFLFLIILFGLTRELTAQVTTYRLRFKYNISKKKIKSLYKSGYEITDDSSYRYTSCANRFKFLVSNKDGVLSLDPWSIKRKGDDCYDTTRLKRRDTLNIINSQTKNKLKISLPPRNKIGDPTKSITLHYQTWIVGVNVLGIKIRRSIRDYNDSLYALNATAGSVNLGLSVGYSFGWTTFTHRSNNSWSITPGTSFGFSSASLSKEPLKRKISTTYSSSNFIFSPSGSITIARNDIGFIFSYGHDIMFGSNSDAWAYQGKGFFAFGIAAGLKL